VKNEYDPEKNEYYPEKNESYKKLIDILAVAWYFFRAARMRFK